jgi:hypothetical protein
MDKIVVTAADIELLLKWRDQHPDEVRSHPAPLKAVEIVVETNGWRIKGIRNGLHLSLYLNQNGRSFGHCEFVRRVDGMWASTKNRMQVERDDLQSVLTVYCTLMALMAHSPVIRSEDEPAPRKAHTKGAKKSHKRSSTQTTYIIRKVNGTLLAAPSGSHASPCGIFTVRGHYRHYKSGKVVWVAEYKKGTGKKKSKTYKVGGDIA